MPQVWCGNSSAALNSAGSLWTGVIDMSSPQNYRTVCTGGSGAPTFGGTPRISAVEAGELCPDLFTGGVWMPVSTYHGILAGGNEAAVVAELQNGWNIVVIVFAGLCLIAGLWFGWKVVQRGGSQ